MKSILTLVALTFVTGVFSFIAKADDEGFCPPNIVANIPANSWEQHVQGVSVTLDLAEWIEDSAHHRRAIKVYIKNTSNIDKYLMDFGDDFGIQIFYINPQASPILLHNVDLLHRNLGLRTVFPAAIKPGQVLVCTIGLEQNEFDLLKSHPVKCAFYVSNQGRRLEIDDHNKIETSPVMLASRSFKRFEPPW